MTRTRFHQGLDDLKQKLLVMGGMAEQAVERAARAFQTQDLSVCQLVLRDEPKINSTEREVDELAIDLLAMQQPMAIDLRLIIACINREIFEAANYAMTHSVENHRYALDTLLVARNLERVADHATNIAEDVIFWIQGADVRHHAQT